MAASLAAVPSNGHTSRLDHPWLVILATVVVELIVSEKGAEHPARRLSWHIRSSIRPPAEPSKHTKESAALRVNVHSF